MPKRLLLLIGAVLLFALIPQIARADDPPGAKLFATYCAACHGAAGKGGFAPAIGAAEFLKANDDDAIIQATTEGTAAKGMPAWGKSKGGTLSDDQIANIVAYLRSQAPAAAPAPATSATTQPAANVVFIQTTLSVAQSTDAAGETVLTATLREYGGDPVKGAVVAFSRGTMFGVVDLGTARTDANGVAALTLSDVPEGARAVTATFKGDKNLDPSSAKFVIEARSLGTWSGDLNLNGVRLSVDEPLLQPEGSLITPNPPLLPTVIFALVVGCVWAIYGYVVYQAYGILKRGQAAPRENVLSPRR